MENTAYRVWYMTRYGESEQIMYALNEDEIRERLDDLGSIYHRIIKEVEYEKSKKRWKARI